MSASTIFWMTLPILAIVIAPESVSTTLQSASLTIATVTSSASPRARPLKAVFDMALSRSAKLLTLSRSRLSSGINPSARPSWRLRTLVIVPVGPPACARSRDGMRACVRCARRYHASVPPERDTLSERIHLLGNALGETIVEQEGRALFELVEEIRGLAKAFRAGDVGAGERLNTRVAGLPPAEAHGVAKAFAAYFQLVNLAEEQERLRILRQRTSVAEAKGAPMGETLADAFATLAREGVGADGAQALLGGLRVMPVFTAHPTEAKRRTVLFKHDRLAAILARLETAGLLPEER